MPARSSAKPAQPVVDDLQTEAGEQLHVRAHVALTPEGSRAFIDDAILGRTPRDESPEMRSLVERVKKLRAVRSRL